MFTQPTQTIVQWQDLKVASDADLVLTIAQQHGWKDCEIFGNGDMITQPQEMNGWDLIPADQYEYSIPAEGVNRIVELMNAGIRIQGVIIADDQRKPTAPDVPGKPEPQEFHHNLNDFDDPKNPADSLPSTEQVLSFIGKGLLILIAVAIAAFIGVWFVAGAIVLSPLFLLSRFENTGYGNGDDYDYDPKLVLLVDDGTGKMVWVSILTWYD